MAIKKIKIYEGVRVNYDHEITELNYICELWDMFGWDIKNDPQAKECADMITRDLLLFHYVDLTKMANGKMLIVELIPPKD